VDDATLRRAIEDAGFDPDTVLVEDIDEDEVEVEILIHAPLEALPIDAD
jgi:hypothetical protein